MSRKPYNFRRGGGSGTKSQRRFGGTGSLGNYKRSGNRNDGHAENRRSGSWGGDNFNRSYNGSNNHSNNNNSFGSISNSKLNNQEDSFQKFRDPNALEQYNGNSRYHHNSQGRDRGQDRHGGKAHFGNETYKNELNWYEDQRNAHLSQAEEQNQNYSSSSAMQVSSTSSMPQTISSVTPSTITSTTPKNPPHDEECNLESKKHILKNIKQEKTEVEEVNRISKQTHKPASSSSSSSESSESEDEALTSNQPKNIAKSNTIKVKQEALGKQIQKKNTEQSTSSDSSSSSSSSEEDNKISDKVSTKPNIIMEKGSKTAKKQSKKKQASEEDLICLGKLERNFVIEDDVSEDTEISSHNKSGTFKNQCLICDKQGHTAFECQMICKNCSAPYHNMKSCPKPVNLSTMLQSYMEFCIGQMSQFNPEKKFMMPPNICISENSLTKSNEQSTVQNKRVKRLRTKSEDSLKRPTKRKHRYASKSSDDEEDEKNDAENKTRTETSESESESVSSEELISTKVKKRRTKMSSPMKTPKFHNTFVPQFSSFPAFGAAAATYNPLLLGQLMNSGGFGAADKLIFQ
ncbi:protein mushroom body miniature [Bactrocera dorsalis]|uniref:Protein mushroom body miniature n=1 Tax=Bactrocera dorsalis TaxID=27457 RepID=A0A6I9VQF3_BACDO|nr:protein mushroom body miniature [Bactrocera dorsalis]